MTSQTAAAAQVDNQKAEIEQREKIMRAAQLIVGSATMNDLLTTLPPAILDIFGAERTTIFALDTQNNQLFSMTNTGTGLKEIRVPLARKSIAGFVGLMKKPLNIVNVYDPTELQAIHPQLEFDVKWDQASGFHTKQVLCCPILNDGYLLGVLQVINTKHGRPFQPRELAAATEVSKHLGIAMFNLNRMRTLRSGKKRTPWSSLVDAGVISEEELEKAATAAANEKVETSRYLLDRMGVKRTDLERSLADYYNCEVFRPSGEEAIPEDYRHRLKADYLKRICAAPLAKANNRFTVVIDDPRDLARTDILKAIEPNAQLDIMVGVPGDIKAVIDRSFGVVASEPEVSFRDLLAADTETTEEIIIEEDNQFKESDSTVVRLASQIIMDAYKRGASDIHVETNGKDRNTLVRFRIDGDCVVYQELPPAYRNPIIARYKIMAKLDIAERRKPQDGKIRFRLGNRDVELRVATYPNSYGNEDVVLRILAASKPMPIDKMGLLMRNQLELSRIVQSPYGLILCVGPTGSGKTTTLHSLLGSINTPDMKILTAEDPVEITQAGLRQVQINPAIGFTFAAAMRSFLRADPDVIMIGEMRDHETASTAVEASLTGHLVFSTLHTNNAPETLTRLLDMGLDPFSFADALLAVLAQRLARALCPDCKEQLPATEDEMEEIINAYGRESFAAHFGTRDPTTFKLGHPRGCSTCGGSGYKGRIGLHELLVTNEEIKRAIQQKAMVGEIRNLAMAGGMTTLLQDGIQKVLQGATDMKQVLAVCSR